MEERSIDPVLLIDLLAGDSGGKVMGNLPPKKLASMSDVSVEAGGVQGNAESSVSGAGGQRQGGKEGAKLSR